MFLDKMPTVISCCFCCFLRAGTVMIAIFSFLIGLLFAPNINYTNGFWNFESILSNYNEYSVIGVQITMGIVSIMLCVVSVLLLVGALCNIPRLILIYELGAILYCITVVVTFLMLAVGCFFVYKNCYVASGVLIGLIVMNVLFTIYFLIVTNSLRMSISYLNSDEFKSVL